MLRPERFRSACGFTLCQRCLGLNGGGSTLSRFYSDIDDLWDGNLDGLIVTGTEPKATNLVEEPSWGLLGQVIDWAKENTVSTVWSCLAVHGAVLYLDGIDRHQLGEKCLASLNKRRMKDHPLMQGAPSQLRTPHSRWNEVGEQSLVSTATAF